MAGGRAPSCPLAETLGKPSERLGRHQKETQALDPDDAAGSAERLDGGVVVGDRAGMGRRGPSTDRGAAAEQGDDRLLGGDRARHPPEALVILDRFDIEKRRADLRPIAQPGKIILDAEMHGVADRDDRRERQRAGIGLVDEFLGERA